MNRTGKWQSPTILVAFAFFIAWMARQGRLSAAFQSLAGKLDVQGGDSSNQYPQDTGSLSPSNVATVKQTAATGSNTSYTAQTPGDTNIPIRQVPDRQAANP